VLQNEGQSMAGTSW